jgi:hypothetical protein
VGYPLFLKIVRPGEADMAGLVEMSLVCILAWSLQNRYTEITSTFGGSSKKRGALD